MQPQEGPQGHAMPHPTGKPDGFAPPFVAPHDITLQNIPFSKNDPWLINQLAAQRARLNRRPDTADTLTPKRAPRAKCLRRFAVSPFRRFILVRSRSKARAAREKFDFACSTLDVGRFFLPGE